MLEIMVATSNGARLPPALSTFTASGPLHGATPASNSACVGNSGLKCSPEKLGELQKTVAKDDAEAEASGVDDDEAILE